MGLIGTFVEVLISEIVSEAAGEAPEETDVDVAGEGVGGIGEIEDPDSKVTEGGVGEAKEVEEDCIGGVWKVFVPEPDAAVLLV